MAEVLRFLRDALYQLSSIQVYGVGIDFILHLLLAFVAVLVLYKFFSLRKSVFWVVVLIAAKEVLDLFAKSRIDYIRSPTLDVVVDVVFGGIGIAAAVWLLKRREPAWLVLSGLAIAAAGAVAVVVQKTMLTSGSSLHTLSQLADALLKSRAAAWASGLEQMARSPLVGNGAVENVYNVYLQLGAGFGVPALLAFLVLVFYCVLSINNSGGVSEARQSIVHGCFWGVIALAVVSLAESTLGNQIAYLNWTILLLLGCRNLWAPPTTALEKRYKFSAEMK